MLLIFVGQSDMWIARRSSPMSAEEFMTEANEMKYIADGERGFDHEPYWRYLDSVEGIMPPHLFKFASNPENHDGSPNSLHDSWLEYWNVLERVIGDKPKFRELQIEACFLGSRHDRRIHLHYGNVQRHSISAGRFSTHGDLLIHELAIEAAGLFSHELLFANGSTFTVHFKDLEHRIELIK
jgi:hypothetical protein